MTFSQEAIARAAGQNGTAPSFLLNKFIPILSSRCVYCELKKHSRDHRKMQQKSRLYFMIQFAAESFLLKNLVFTVFFDKLE